MNQTRGKIIIDGNAAAALGAMFAGVTVVTWYPITPSSFRREQLIDYLKKYRFTPMAKRLSPSYKRKTNWPLWAWFWARDGQALDR